MSRDAALNYLRERRLIFWDFDGVIKDSVSVKGDTFARLFEPYGREIAERVRRHHEENGGLSRFHKIPLYLAWAGEASSDEQVKAFCDQFGAAVRQAVINAPWVPGVREYIRANHSRQFFVLLTATPQAEIEDIAAAIDLDRYFAEIHGAPSVKSVVVRDALRRQNCCPEDALLVGDSETDYVAAQATGIPFLLRRTKLNEALRARYSGPWIDSLTTEN